MTIDIDEAARAEIAGKLSTLLADTYSLYLKTQNFHWNVTGPMFPALHAMFEGQYIELRDAVDLVAERIRTLEHPAPGSFEAYRALTSIEGAQGVPDALDMVRSLAEGHEQAARTAKEVVTAAENAGDVATADLATQRVDVHEKTVWMLKMTAG